MTEKIDLSLDDIIKINKKQNHQNKANRPNRPNRPTNKVVSKIRPKLPQKQHAQSTAKDPGQTMLHVSNLHFKVSNKDLKELFEDIAPIKKAAVHYDESGRSLGTAEVIFWTRDAAIKAIKKYNSRILDGRPMSIALVPSSNPAAAAPRMGVKPNSGIHKRSQASQPSRRSQRPQTKNSPRKAGPASKGRNVKGKGARQPKKEITQEELDADLEAYTMKID